MENPFAFSIAPMMKCTDRHCRYLMRLISRRARLYTEMVTSAALVRGRDPQRVLAFDPSEQPLALQLGGSDPAQLATAARMAEDWGFNEINLNVGCPSDRVTSGRFGACLMAEPDLVAACVAAMNTTVRIPVTVKTRIGIDELDSDAHLDHFVTTVAAAGCDTFIIHARKAWLKGLSPKENREIPPLKYERVYALKRSFPTLRLVLNGGLKTCGGALTALADHGTTLDGVMLGRAPYDEPYMLADVDRLFYADITAPFSRAEVAEAYVAYARTAIDADRGGHVRPHHVLRHAAGLFHGRANARQWRQTLAKAGQDFQEIGQDLDKLALLARTLDSQPALAA